MNNSMSAYVDNNKIYINGRMIPPCPYQKNGQKIFITGNKIFINGFEYNHKKDKWRRTLKAVWHYLF